MSEGATGHEMTCQEPDVAGLTHTAVNRTIRGEPWVLKNHCHQLAFNSPKVDGGEFGGETPGFRLAANTGVDMRSAIPTITTTMLLRQYFTLTFMTVYLLLAY